MALEGIAASSRAPLERGLGQQRGSESERAYHFQCSFRTASMFKRQWVLQELPSDLCIHPQSGHFPPTKMLPVIVSLSSPAHYFPRDMPPFLPPSISQRPAV